MIITHLTDLRLDDEGGDAVEVDFLDVGNAVRRRYNIKGLSNLPLRVTLFKLNQ